MTIENNLKRIADSLEKLANMPGLTKFALSLESVKEDREPGVSVPTNPLSEIPVSTPATVPAPPPAPSATVTELITPKTLNVLAQEKVAKLGDAGAAVRAVLAEFGCTGLVQLSSDKYPEFKAKLEAL